MAEIVVAGGGICGMSAAMMLAHDGHDVTLLERDEASPPASVDDAWESWNRRSVAQFRLAHVLFPRGYSVLAATLPEAAAELESCGGLRIEFRRRVPVGHRRCRTNPRRRSIRQRHGSTNHHRTGASEHTRCRASGGSAARGGDWRSAQRRGVDCRRAARVRRPSASGEELHADLVVDATGRRSPTVDWITAIGGRAPDETAEDSGFSYYGRFYRSADGSVPELRSPILSPLGSISVLCIASDNGTWSITLYASSADAPTRRFRDVDVFEKIVGECPLHAHWLDGEPISDMASMSGVVDRTRRFVVDGVPVVTGMLSIADAYACTNPSLGRGMTLGLMHTELMRNTVREHLDRPADLAIAFHEGSVADLDPWHDATRQLDRARNEEMKAVVEGRQPPEDPVLAISGVLFGAATSDAEVARWAAEIVSCLSLPSEVLAREGVFDRLLELGESIEPLSIPGPDRQRLLDLCS